jgi:hypothetical protein
MWQYALYLKAIRPDLMQPSWEIVLKKTLLTLHALLWQNHTVYTEQLVVIRFVPKEYSGRKYELTIWFMPR